MQIKPAFNKNNIAVVLSADDNYVPYLAVTIKSILDHANPKYNYDIVIFDDGISEHHKRRMAKLISLNASIRYVNVKELIKGIDLSLFQVRGIWSMATYYRLFIPQIMSDYDRVLYLDCDILVRNDLTDLFDMDMKGNQIACVYDDIRYTNNKARIKDCEEKLKLKNYRCYFNAGVILFNVSKIKYEEFKEQFFYVLRNYELPFQDQDVLNIIFEDKCKFLDFAWNYQCHTLSENPQLANVEELSKAAENPKIIHYTSPFKPWKYPDLLYADEWWEVARKIPFYEEIIFKNTITSNLLLRNLVMHKRLLLKYQLCKMLRTISFGKLKRKISMVCNKLQSQVKAVRKVFKVK